ncbi:hypothetical protein ACFXTI_032190 [Malus domestica]
MACPSFSSCGGAAVTSSSGISSSLPSWIVMWKRPWTSASVLSFQAYWHEDWPVWMMVRLLTFSGLIVSTSKIAWCFILEGIELQTPYFSARPSSFSSFGVIFLFSKDFLVSSTLSKTNCSGRELAVLLYFLGFDNLSKIELWDVGMLSLLKMEVRS